MNQPDEETRKAARRGRGERQSRPLTGARRRRPGVVTAALLVGIATLGGVVGCNPGDDTDRADPAPSPAATQVTDAVEAGATGSPSASATGAVTSLGRIDWRNAVMNLPVNRMCPHRRVRFTDGKASLPPWQYRIAPNAQPVYGDVNGDGFTDAVVVITCWGNADVGGPETRFTIIAFTGNAKGGPVPIGYLDGMQAYVDPVPTLRDGGRTVAVDWNSPSDTLFGSYRWNGTRFVRAG